MKRILAIAILAVLITVAMIVTLRRDPPPERESPQARRPPPPMASSGSGSESESTQPPPPVLKPSPEVAPPPPDASTILRDLARALEEEDLEKARRLLAKLREIAVPPKLPDDQNAAILYEEAFLLLKNIPKDEAAESAYEKALAGESLSDAELQALRDWRIAHVGVLDLLREAARMPSSRFLVDYDQGMAAKLPHVGSAIGAAKVLRRDALILELEGRNADSLEASWAGLAMSRAFRGDSIAVSQLVGIVIEGISANALQGVLDPSSPDLAAFLDASEPTEMRSLFVRSLLGTTFGVVTSLVDRGWADVPVRPQPEPIRWTDVAYYVETMAELVNLAGRPFFESRERLELLEKERTAGASGVAKRVQPYAWRLLRHHARSESRLSMLKIAMQLERHRADHGRYPDGLDAGTPVDPFTGNPFVYTRQEGGFILENGAEDPDDHLEWFSTRGW